jgi:acetyltransferase-like isoleucine patch superfamily enzyme
MKIDDVLKADGWQGLLEAFFRVFKKKLFTIWYRGRFKYVGRRTVFEGPLKIRGAKFITIGADCVIQEGAEFHVSAPSQMIIGDKCFLGSSTQFYCTGDLLIHDHTHILKNTEVNSGQRVEIGPFAWIAKNCMLTGRKIVIGEHAILGPHVSIFTGDHLRDKNTGFFEMGSDGTHQAVTVGRGAWVGSRALLLKGVEIGEGCVIGAGAVVNRSLPDFCLAAGVPAKQLKTFSPVLGPACDHER